VQYKPARGNGTAYVLYGQEIIENIHRKIIEEADLRLVKITLCLKISELGI